MLLSSLYLYAVNAEGILVKTPFAQQHPAPGLSSLPTAILPLVLHSHLYLGLGTGNLEEPVIPSADLTS